MNYRTASYGDLILEARRYIRSDRAMPVDLSAELIEQGMNPQAKARILTAAAMIDAQGPTSPINLLRDLAAEPEAFTVSTH
jgi:hypothetical protein